MKKLAVVLLLGSIASAARADEIISTSTLKPEFMIGLEMIGKGKISKFWDNELSDGANAMLHGYAPRAGDVVEFYIRQADCDVPDVKCNFEIAIRKKNQP
jgi:hypothetical protein